MAPNILITGAAGYIGGSLVTDFLAGTTIRIEKDRINAAVRSEEQAKAVSRQGVNVLQLDLTNEKAVVDSLLTHKINIVIHTASSIDPTLALNLVTALAKQKQASGEQTYFIHTSGLSAFYSLTGWPAGETKDTAVFKVEKRLADSFPIRKTDTAVIEYAEAQGVTSFVVIPPLVYGQGSGEWNKLSVVLPPLVKASISRKQVYKFPGDSKVSGVHITDLIALYGRLVDKIIRKETLPSGKEGYYFALAHDIVWRETLDRLVAALNARGLIKDSHIEDWPSDGFAAEALGVPKGFVQAFWNAGDDKITHENTSKVGWQPEWNNDLFLKNIDDEIAAVLEHDKAKSSLMDSLFKHAGG
ncbi:hypothetical protein MMC10_006455 [Thelotrema lepadinum]|nr:hypothetical protein [Thelotrema lepadinum]